MYIWWMEETNMEETVIKIEQLVFYWNMDIWPVDYIDSYY